MFKNPVISWPCCSAAPSRTSGMPPYCDRESLQIIEFNLARFPVNGRKFLLQGSIVFFESSSLSSGIPSRHKQSLQQHIQDIAMIWAYSCKSASGCHQCFSLHPVIRDCSSLMRSLPQLILRSLPVVNLR